MDQTSNKLEIDTYTEIFAWGADRYGQLGLGNQQGGRCYSTPRFCSFSIIIRAVSCGEEHSSLITGDGQIFTVGSNSEGRLGLGDRIMTQSTTPCLVEALSHFNAIHIYCGWGHTAAVMDNGELYTWGVGEHGALGIADTESQWFPVKVTLPGKQPTIVVNATCGTRHTAIVDNKGTLYMCGAGDAGQLGTNARTKELLPKAITAIPEPVVYAACGVFHTVSLTKSGKVYVMGGNNLGQLGIGSKRSVVVPMKIKDLDDLKIVKVAAGNHTAALTDKGDLFVWGTGVFGEYLSPTLFGKPGTFNAPLTDVSIGGSFGAVLDSKGNLYSWGSNTSGELGMGDFEPRPNPILTKGLQGKIVTKMSCGGSYAIALGRTIGSDTVQSRISKEVNRYVDDKVELEEPETPEKPPEEQPLVTNFSKPTSKHEPNNGLLEAIKEQRQKKIELEKQIRELEQATNKGSDTQSDSLVLKDKIAEMERQIEAERKRGIKIMENIKELKLKVREGNSAKYELDRKINSLQRSIASLREENTRLRTSQKSGDTSRLSELLREYEEKIEREIQEKYRVLKDKQREILNLQNTIPKLKMTISEIEEDKAKLEEYYKDEIKKLENIILDYNKRIDDEERNKEELEQVHIENNVKLDELKKAIAEATYKKNDLAREIESCRNDIDQVNFQVLNKQTELERELDNCENLKLTIAAKEDEIKALKEQFVDKENQHIEELNKLTKQQNDKAYDNEDIQNRINVRQIEIDTLNKDLIAWKQVASNVAIENEALKKIVESLEDKNRRLIISSRSQIESHVKQEQDRYADAMKVSQSPMKISKIISEPQNIEYGSPERSYTGQVESHGKQLKALEAYASEDDEGVPLEQVDKITDPYLQGLDYQSNSPEQSWNSESTKKLVHKLGVDSPIRKIVATKSLESIQREVLNA